MAHLHHHDRGWGWDQCYLTARTGHVVGLSEDRVLAATVNPKQGTIDWTLVACPSGRQRANDLA